MEILLLLLFPLALVGLSFGGGDESDDDQSSADQDEVLQGGANDNMINGGAGNDLIFGNRGDDSLYGGTGNDILVGGRGEDDLQGNTGADILLGGSGDDNMQGHAGSDLLLGGAGDDTMDGGAGDDVMVASSGADLLYGGAGNDIMSSQEPSSGAPGSDLSELDLTAFRAEVTGFYGPKLSNVALDRMIAEFGSADADNSPDSMYGGSGNDILVGDNGDTLSGGADLDSFAVAWQPGNAAVDITDLDAATGEELVILSDNDPSSGAAFFLRAADGGAATEVVLEGEVVALLNGVSLAQAQTLPISLHATGSETIFTPGALVA